MAEHLPVRQFAINLPLAVAASLSTAGCGFSPSSDPEQYHVAETKDRLPDDQMEQLVDGPMTVVRDRGLAAGQRDFERLLEGARAAKGRRSVQVGDLLTAFAVQLYVQDPDPKGAYYRAATAYLKKAVTAYRAAFGTDHPEVALALNSYADIELKTPGPESAARARAALEEAYGIRIRRLGPRHPETRANMTRLARIYTAQADFGKDPALLVKADRLYQLAIASGDDSPDADETANRAAVRMARAQFLAEHGAPMTALAEAKMALDTSDEWPDPRACRLVGTPLAALTKTLRSTGHETEAGSLPPQSGQGPCERMVGSTSPFGFLRTLFG